MMSAARHVNLKENFTAMGETKQRTTNNPDQRNFSQSMLFANLSWELRQPSTEQRKAWTSVCHHQMLNQRIPKQKPLTAIFYTRQISGELFQFLFLLPFLVCTTFRWRPARLLPSIDSNWGNLLLRAWNLISFRVVVRKLIMVRGGRCHKKNFGKAERKNGVDTHARAPTAKLKAFHLFGAVRPSGKQMIMNGISFVQHWRATSQVRVAVLIAHSLVILHFHVNDIIIQLTSLYMRRLLVFVNHVNSSPPQK